MSTDTWRREADGAASDVRGEPATTRLPGITSAVAASLGAGAVHAAAVGGYSEHPAVARILVMVAAAQLLAAVAALMRPSTVVCWVVAGVNAAVLAGWAVTRVTGISWIDGLHVRETPQFPDTVGALLTAAAIGSALAAALLGWQHAAEQRRAGALVPALVVAALAVPAMFFGATRAHARAAGPSTSTPASVGTAGAAPPASASATTVADAHQHEHAADPATTTPGAAPATTATTPPTTAALADDGTPVRPWPRPWDPAQPIDVGGVPGVSPDQEARAVKLIEGTLADLPRFADPSAAVAAGYASIGDAATGSEHYIKTSLIQDGDMLDPTAPESLVYSVVGDQRVLAGAMYIASSRPLDDPSLLDYAGPLITWHVHDNLCWSVGRDGSPKVVGLTDASGNCARGVKAGGDNPMVHVWIVPRPCGVFSALEGVGAGSTAVPADQRTDTCTAAHDHTATGPTAPPTNAPATTTATSQAAGAASAAAVPTHRYDPTQPIDLSGVPGVTPAQQAAAENLVAINVVRLPQWSDPATAEAAGFHSIGDAATGFEHYINWDWINDKVWLDPDHPESLVYEIEPDGSKRLVSAMYMLPSDVALTAVPDIGGALMQWHVHDNLCITNDRVAPQVVTLTGAGGSCPAGLRKFPLSPMIHVWIVPNKCGPFAALDGEAAGQVAPGQTAQCDHLHGDGLLG